MPVNTNKQIQEAMGRGDFNHPPGKAKPLNRRLKCALYLSNWFIRRLLLLMGGVCLCLSAFGHDDASTLLEDVNEDGVVNILDLVLVANAFGQPVDRNAAQNPDVNRDGTINVFDLIWVANRFGETAENDNSTYHDIQDYIFDKSCAKSFCHTAPTNAGNLNLTYGLSYQDLVGRVPQNLAAASAGMKRVDPGNPENSFLLTKLMGPTAPAQGARMPLGAGATP